ncbi:MAG: hypothetical protein ACREXS_00715 [Gammaproteobacteria bacterium]
MPNLSTSMPQVLAQKVGCGGMVIVPPGQGLKHTPRLPDGVVVQQLTTAFACT